MPKEMKLETEALNLDAMGEEATASYRGMVRKQAQGEPIDPRKLQPILVLAGRGLDAFRADAGRLKERFQATAQLELADSDATAEEINAAQKRLRGLEAERKTLMEDLARRATELNEKIAAAQSEVLKKSGGPGELRAQAVRTLHATAAPSLADELRRLEKATRDAQYKRLASKTRGPALSKQAAKEEERAAQKAAEIGALVLEPFDGMAWS